MKTTVRLAALSATLMLVTGCTGHFRHKEKSLGEPVQLPSAPKLEHGAAAPSIPNMTSDSPSPLSASGLAPAPGH